MALNIGVKFEGKLTCAFKNDMRNFSKFGSYELKIYRGVIWYVNEE